MKQSLRIDQNVHLLLRDSNGDVRAQLDAGEARFVGREEHK